MELLNQLIKYLTLAAVSYTFFIKVVSLKLISWKKLFFAIKYIVLTTFSFVVLKDIVVEPYRTAVVVIGISIVLSILLRERFEVMLTTLIIIFASCYVLYLFSIIIAYLIMYPFGITNDEILSDSWRYTVAGIVSIVISVMLSKIKLEFGFIYKKYTSGIFVSISGIIIVLYGLFREGESISDESAYLLMAGFVLLGYGIYCWLRRETTISKNENAKDIINKKQQAILEQKEKDYNVLREMHDYLAMVVHKDDKKLDAMQRAVEKVVLQSDQSDVLSDAGKILEEISLSRERTEREFYEKVYNGRELPKTGLGIVDAKFETVSERAMLKGIDITLELEGDVRGLDRVIPQFDLANIIGDLAENAFIALKHLGEEQPCRKIEFGIRESDNGYELSMSDSGIPFETEVLLKLGVERVTSHAEEGGSGYGYETIFGLLREYGASLIITEYEPVPYAFSKNIAIRFDGREEYMIRSYRADILRKRNSNTYLIITS